jgi:hypothetical protein
VSARIQALGPTQIAISIITVEEQLRGWLAAIRNATTAQARVTAYERLRMAVEYFASVTLLNYTVLADIGRGSAETRCARWHARSAHRRGCARARRDLGDAK